MALCQKREAVHPRDGPWAWLVCFSCFLINVFLFGVLLGFGVFLPVLSKEFNTSRGATAWIGSLAMGLMFMCGPITIKLVQFIGERKVGFFTGLTAAALTIGSSFVQHVEILYISYGICLGFCGSCLMSCFSKSLQRYFKKHIGLASGISTAGGSIGVLIFTPTLQALVEFIGWRGAMRVVSGAMVLSGLTSLSFDPNVEGEKCPNNREEQPKRNCRAFLGFWDCSIWRNPKYTVGVISLFLNFLGLYIPNVHMITFAKDLNIPASKTSLLFIYVGICSAAVRVITGKVVDKGWLSALQCVQLSSFILGLSLLLFTQAKVYNHFLLLNILYAVGNGVFISAQYTFLLTCFSDVHKSYVGLSMCYTVVSIALLVGVTIFGFVSDLFNSYVPAFYIFGGIIIFSGTLPFCLLLLKDKEKESFAETRLKLIGSRLANVESSLTLNV